MRKPSRDSYRWRLNFCPDTQTLVEFYENAVAELGKPKKSRKYVKFWEKFSLDCACYEINSTPMV